MWRALLPYGLAAACGAAALLANAVLHALWPDWRWHHEPLHSAIEAIGGLVAIAMATVLLQTRNDVIAGKYQMLAAGFLGMGILEEFHAIARPGNGFVLFRNLASLAGAVGFAMVWRLPAPPVASAQRRHAWVIGTGALLVGGWFLIFPTHIPDMLRNGEFTPLGIAPQTVACILFLAAGVRLLDDYRRSGRSEDALFASLALLYSLAEFVFIYSIPWDNRWWFWHALRLVACLLALAYIAQKYFQVTSDLRTSLKQTLEAKETLGQSESRLRHLFDERERMSQDLHDSTIQSLFALGLSLERCQRLVATSHQEVATQLHRAVTSLQTVIRDLRGYLTGVKSPAANGRALEAALSSLVSDMNNTSHRQYRLEVNSAAVDRLTADQAQYLLPIAREAMSNSLRHSGAQAGALSLQLEGRWVRLIVEDDGRGFDAAALQRHGHGLTNIEARVKRLGGRLEVISGAGQGTRIVCDLPQERDDVTI
ncbi:MAG TPA: ATP-binding protein [Nitrospira sp.]|nr:ATP-binding protein [Nitrospira sp.]